MSEPLNDIEFALIRLRLAFQKHNIPVPDVLEYSDSKKGYDASMGLRLAAQQSASWVMDDKANPYVEMCLHGFTVRFEARNIERPGTGLNLDDGEAGYVFKDDYPFRR